MISTIKSLSASRIVRNTLVIGIVLSAAQASLGQPAFGVGGNNIDSDDLGPFQGPWYTQNCQFWTTGTWGSINFTYTGSTNFKVGAIRIMGEAVGANLSTRPSELRFAVCNLSTFTHFFSGALHPSTQQSWTVPLFIAPFTTNGMAVQDGSSLGDIHPGDNLEIRFYESYDTGPAVDAIWNTVQVTFFPKPPPPDGNIGRFPFPISGVGLGTDTTGSDYDTQMGLYDPNGALVAFDDDGAGIPNGPSAISLDGLPPGEYYLAIAGPGATFDDGYAVTPALPGIAGGNLVLNHPGGSTEASTHPESVVWYRLELVDSCQGDVDGDRAVNLNDLVLVLANFGVTCP